MKLFLGLLLLLSTDAFSATGSGNISSTGIMGGGASGPGGTSIPAPITLPIGSVNVGAYTVSSAGANGGAPTAARYYSFAKMAGSGGQWFVPAGKIAVCFQQTINVAADGNSEKDQFGYATAVITNDSASVTGGVCYSPTGSCTNNADGALVFTGTKTNLPQIFNYTIIFDASSTGANTNIYPFFRPNGTDVQYLNMLCYQQ